MSATSVLGMRAGLDQEWQQDPAPGVRDAAGLLHGSGVLPHPHLSRHQGSC